MRRTLFFTSLVASFIIGCGIIGCGGTNASSPVPPPQTPQTAPPPAGSQHEEPAPPPAPPGPPMRADLVNVVPSDWVRLPGKPVLLNVALSPLIRFMVYKVDGKSAKEELENSLSNSQGFKTGKIETSPDGLRAWASLTGTDPKIKQKARLVVRHIPKEKDTPADVMVECFGVWPANLDVQLSKEIDTYVDSYKFE